MSASVEELSSGLASVVESTARSLVRVEGRRRPASGVAWQPDLVVTANHGLEWTDELGVGLPDGSTRTATLVGRDPSTDLAALRLKDAGLTPAAWTELEGLKVGHLVLAVSRPGRTAQARLGIVAALGDSWRTPAGGRIERYLETDVALHSGLSGSALVDAGGRVRGLNTTGLLRGTAMAIPVSTLKRVVEALLAHGQVRRGYLGIGTQPVHLPPTLQQQLGQPRGLLVSSVQPDSPAARGGLLLGDVLAGIEGQALAHPAELLPFLEEDRIGSELHVRVIRGGDVRELTVQVGPRPDKE
jgi:S1-C subfamily serine protease